MQASRRFSRVTPEVTRPVSHRNNRGEEFYDYMKNQYFSDRRDFFKYDFLLALMEGVPGLRRFLFVPMLTPDDGSTDGTLTDYIAGEHPRRRDLWEFLQGCLKRGERDIRALRRFMKGKTFEYIPWSDDAFFTHAGREEYFAKIPAPALRQSLVFFDPDNGFEVPSMTARNGAKFLRYQELANVFSRMDDASVAVVYQHLPRKNRGDFFAETSEKIRKNMSAREIFVVSDNTIAFFVIPKSPGTTKAARPVLISYAREHDLRFWEAGGSVGGIVDVVSRLMRR